MNDRSELQALLDKARTSGARAAEVHRAVGTSLEQAGPRRTPTTARAVSWRVRVYRDAGQTGVGVAATGAEALAAALTASQAAAPDPLAGPVDKLAIRAGGLGIDDRRHASIAEEDRAELLATAERAFDGTVVALRDLLYREERVERAWMSTRGVEAAEAATTYALTGRAVAGELSVPHAIRSRHFSDVASLPFGMELRRRVEPLLRPGSAPPGLPVVLDPRVMAELVRGLAPAFVANGGSFVNGRAGQEIGSDVLHLTDDAGLPAGLHSRAFDERGVPPIPVTLVREGRIHGSFHDPESARAQGLRPTGHVREGSLRPSNQVLRPGARTRNVILTELGENVALDELPPLDLATGRLRGRARFVFAQVHDRRCSWTTSWDLPIETLLRGLVEVAGDEERVGEVDAPTGLFRGIPY